MTIKELLDIASSGYPDEYLSTFYDEEGNKTAMDEPGDTLAKFIVIELIETFAETGTDEEQIDEAIRVMERAREDISGVIGALADAVHVVDDEERANGPRRDR